MATRYYEVHNPTSADKSNSVGGVNSPFIKHDASNETWLLTYTNDSYTPTNGVLEYHVDKTTRYDGKVTAGVNKMPDPFAIEDLRRRGHELVEGFWFSLDIPVADRVTMHKNVDVGLHMLELGDFPAARYEVNSLTVDSVLTTPRKAAILSSIDAVLDDYPHLK